MEGKYLPLKETVRGFQEILEGKHDQIPEHMFLFAGGIDEVVEKYEASRAEASIHVSQAEKQEETKDGE